MVDDVEPIIDMIKMENTPITQATIKTYTFKM
jgi:hypothetical protein